MALIATLEFGDNDIKRYSKSYLVSACHVLHRRPYNRFNPEGAATCEQLEVSVICPGRDDLGLYEWYDSMGVQNGRVVIKTTSVTTSDGNAEQIIYFEGAQCFRMRENYLIGSLQRRLLTLSIDAEKIIVDQVEFKRDKI